jgi:cell division topological specificity factor
MKKWLQYFYGQPKNSAEIAKERLKIIVAHQRSQRNTNDFIPKLRQELIDVIRKYVHVDQNLVRVDIETDGNNTILELNIPLSEETHLQAEKKAVEAKENS